MLESLDGYRSSETLRLSTDLVDVAAICISVHGGLVLLLLR